MKKKLWAIILILVLIIALIAGVFLWRNQQQGGAEQEMIQRVLTNMCVYPGQEATKALEAAKTEDPLGALKEIYGTDFTDAGFEDFCNNRYPLNILFAAEEAQCKIQLEQIELLKEASDTDNAYYYNASFLLNEEISVNQKVIVCYENEQITKFQLVNNDLMNEIIHLTSDAE